MDGPYELELMRKLLGWLYENGFMQEEDGTQVSMVVIAEKQHQSKFSCH